MAANNNRSTVFKTGMEEGRAQVKAAVIDYLRNALVDDKENRPDRGSPEYEFGMNLTRNLMKHLESVELK